MSPTDAGGARRSADGRHVIVDGRRWRAADPAIPEPLRRELVAELMAARRAVGVASRTGDAVAERHARARVADAKVALGERGAPWWGATDVRAKASRLEAAMRTLLRHRKPESTICPSDAARIAGGTGWRGDMEAARQAAFELQARGVVEVRRAGARIATRDGVPGPLRIARGPEFAG
jgi:hypothetical protein